MNLLAIIGITLLVSLGPVRAAGSPGESALLFLRALGSEDSSVEEVLGGTRLSPFCGDGKRERITSRLVSLRAQMVERPLALEVIGVEEDGEYAGVLVSAVPEGEVFGTEIYAVGLRKEGGAWGAAPVLGSFANTNVGFDTGIRARVEALELWMGRERMVRLRELHHAAVSELTRQMESAVPEALLHGEDARVVMDGFLAACRRGDLAAALIFLDADPAQANDPESLPGIVLNGLRGGDEAGRWRSLVSPDVVRVVADVRTGTYETVVSVLFYDAEVLSGARLIRFTLRRNAGRWKLSLPLMLREVNETGRSWQRPDTQEHKLRRRFAEFFEADRPGERFAEAAALGARLDEILRDGSLAELFALLARDESHAEGERLVSYAEAARLWKEFRERGRDATHGELIEVLEGGTAGTVVLHLVTTAELDRLELVTVLLLKEAGGWAIAPGVTGMGNWEAMPRQEALDQKQVMMNFVRRKVDLEKVAAERFLEEFVEVSEADEGKVSVEEAGRVVRSFRGFLRAGDLPQAFSLCALLDRTEGAWEALKSLTYEYRGTRKSGGLDRELHVQGGRSWAGVSLRLDSGPTSEPDYPLYLVRATSEGPRIVVDAGLRLVTNKGRKILNERNWARLEAELSPDELGLVRTLFQVHCEHSTTDYTAWEKNIKSSP